MITIEQRSWTKEQGWSEPTTKLPGQSQLVFVFGDRAFVGEERLFEQIKQFYPDAYILIGSTAGNILGDRLSDAAVTVSALHFEKTKIWFAETTVENAFDSKNVGQKLAEFLPTENLVHSFILSDGLAINGSALVTSVNEHLPENVTVTGGLVGDGELFEKTVVGCNAVPQSNRVALIGFYGGSLRVGYASEAGWTTTGDTYEITRSSGNVLYELNGEPALDVYKKLLGDAAKDLPSSGLLFPLELKLPEEGQVIRTILGVNEEEKSVTFAGDMPEGLTACVMHTTDAELIESARLAGEKSTASLGGHKAQFSLLVSCIGRKLVLKKRSSEEIKAVHDAVGRQAAVHGFYSYGELCPSTESGLRCLMHNQTMTVTTLAED